MATKYPNKLDTLTSLPKVMDLVSPIIADDHNRLRDAIVTIQTELGTNPSGTFGTVKDRLDDLFSELFADQVRVIDVDGYFTTLGPDGYKTVESVLIEIGASLQNTASSGTIGAAEDGDYTDGLFTDFVPTTPVGTSIDRFNEVLKELAPSPAPALSDFGYSTSLGVEGNVSFGSSNAIGGYTNVGTVGGGSALDINGTFTSASGAALRKGIYNDSTNKSGAVAEAVPADTGSPTPAYPANAFGDGYDGFLQLELNGSVVHSINLSTFGSGSSTNANGSGFQNVSAGTPVKFPNGNDFNVFFYRTADWIVDSADEQNGYNYLRVIHNNSPTFTRSTNYFEWVVDDDATATGYSGENLSGLSMAGSKHLSGVEYHTSGSATYDITIQNLHRNTYSTSGSAVSHNGTNVSISSSSLGTISSEGDSEVISKTATINANRLLNGSINATTSVDRTIDSNEANSPGPAGISGILLDAVSDNATATNEPLNGEDYRVPSNRSLTDTSGFTSGGAGLWDSTIEIVSSAPSNPGYDGDDGYDAGLLVYNSTLYYPSSASVALNGDFSSIANGPAGNPDYSSASGQRTYWRYFYYSSPAQNFSLDIASSGVSFVPTTTSLGTGSSNAHIELLAPNATSDGVNVEFKDCQIDYTSDNDIGCKADTFSQGVGQIGLTLGSKSTSASGNAVIVRITVGQGWTGNISNISLAQV